MDEIRSDRLNRVEFEVGGEIVAMPWASRYEMLNRIRHLGAARAVVAAIEAVGASRPVKLDDENKLFLVDTIEEWAEQTSTEDLPEGVWELRSALIDDLHARGI